MANGDDSAVIGIKVGPKEERQDSIEVNELHEMTAPGTYSVTASRRVKNLSGKGWSGVVSNTITVTIAR